MLAANVSIANLLSSLFSEMNSSSLVVFHLVCRPALSPTKVTQTAVRSQPVLLRSPLVLHILLNRPGTRGNRRGPDPDLIDSTKHGSEPVQVPGQVSGAWVQVL